MKQNESGLNKYHVTNKIKDIDINGIDINGIIINRGQVKK